jgi:hypothetical protein
MNVHVTSASTTVKPKFGFWYYCDEVDRRLAGKRTCPLPNGWASMSVPLLYETIMARRPAPEVTLHALYYAVRFRGVSALDEPVNIERLSRCDATQREKLNAFIKKLHGANHDGV